MLVGFSPLLANWQWANWLAKHGLKYHPLNNLKRSTQRGHDHGNQQVYCIQKERNRRKSMNWANYWSVLLLFLCPSTGSYVISDRRTLITDRDDQRTAITLISDPSDFKLATFSLTNHWLLCSKWSENSDHWSGCSEHWDHLDLGPFRFQTGNFIFAQSLGNM